MQSSGENWITNLLFIKVHHLPTSFLTQLPPPINPSLIKPKQSKFITPTNPIAVSSLTHKEKKIEQGRNQINYVVKVRALCGNMIWRVWDAAPASILSNERVKGRLHIP